MTTPVVHSQLNPFPFESKSEVVDELCSCGHLRSQHNDSSFMFGHGSCGEEYCHCKQYTFVKFMTNADIELRKIIDNRDCLVRELKSAIGVLFQAAFLSSHTIPAAKKKKVLIDFAKRLSLKVEAVEDAMEDEPVDPEMTSGAMKVSAWLDKMVDGHCIYPDKPMRVGFMEATGKDAPWIARSWDSVAAEAINGGGMIEYDSCSVGGMVGGDEIIRACHRVFCSLIKGELRSDSLRGRGSRARQMVTEISESGN